jgi:hypothetical protein
MTYQLMAHARCQRCGRMVQAAPFIKNCNRTREETATMTCKIATLLLLTALFCSATGAEHTQTQKTNRQNKIGKDRLVNEFIGTLIAVDKQKQTVSVASGVPAKANRDKASVYFLTPETKFFKGELPATLDDGIIGQEVRYGIRVRRDDNKHLLTVLRFLPSSKPDAGK